MTEVEKKKPRRHGEEARGQVGKRDTSEEAQGEGRTREWRRRCGTKQDKKEVCLQNAQLVGLSGREGGHGQNQTALL